LFVGDAGNMDRSLKHHIIQLLN